MNILVSKLRTFARDESGTTNIEYALIATVVSVAGVALFESIGFSLVDFFSDASDGIGGNGPSDPPPNDPPAGPPDPPPECPPLDPCTE